MSTTDEQSAIPTMLVSTQLAGMRIDIALKCGKNLAIVKNTTLNEKYGILDEESIGTKDSREFYLHYYGIGNAGSYSEGMNADYSTKLLARQHQPSDTSLYNMIPMICRKVGEDLSTSVRNKYRMRVIEEIDGESYIFYYLKKIDFDVWEIMTKLRKGTDEGVDFYFDKNNLFPVPIELETEGDIPLTNEFVDVYSELNFSLTEEELEEVKLACRIKYGSSDRASISEVCTVYGIDVVTSGRNGVSSIQYNEVMSATILNILTEASPRIANNNTNMNLYAKIGSGRPMLLNSTSDD